MTTESTSPAASNDPGSAAPDPLILFPGIGADARMFLPQRSAFPELQVPAWIEPETNEPLAHYAARLAKVIDPGRPCFVGGVSFGGAIAVEVATHVQSRLCFLLGSIRHSNSLPRRLQIFRPMSDLIMIPKWVAPTLLRLGGRWFNPSARGVLHQLKETDSHFLRWAAGAILTWQPSPAVADVPVVQIHGDRDWVFPPKWVVADRIFPGAGHLVSMTHAAQVNPFIRSCMNDAPPWQPKREAPQKEQG